ncbi:clathrin light chain B isoform X5 [Brachionus plicatilis]|uniref:Clathrin light chain n=1 Tax=Brachionus plicatilis TaxID=10195 RepID=A0A3M7PES8_BRAPC|nr:clathrin light chain B isoform X5 [Brachionus plicatilis]
MDPFQDSNQFGEDPAAEFLAREEAEMQKIEGLDGEFETKVNLNYNFDESSTDMIEQEREEQPDPYSFISSQDRVVQEPEKIKKWREEQKARIEAKDAQEEAKKLEWREMAKKELADWYKNRQEQLVKTIENNRLTNKASETEIMASRENDSNGHDWERIAKLCDFNPKANKNQKDNSRLRSILLQLKQTPLVR